MDNWDNCTPELLLKRGNGVSISVLKGIAYFNQDPILKKEYFQSQLAQLWNMNILIGSKWSHDLDRPIIMLEFWLRVI